MGQNVSMLMLMLLVKLRLWFCALSFSTCSVLFFTWFWSASMIFLSRGGFSSVEHLLIMVSPCFWSPSCYLLLRLGILRCLGMIFFSTDIWWNQVIYRCCDCDNPLSQNVIYLFIFHLKFNSSKGAAQGGSYGASPWCYCCTGPPKPFHTKTFTFLVFSYPFIYSTSLLSQPS